MSHIMITHIPVSVVCYPYLECLYECIAFKLMLTKEFVRERSSF